jgi:hypothetical protein
MEVQNITNNPLLKTTCLLVGSNVLCLSNGRHEIVKHCQKLVLVGTIA